LSVRENEGALLIVKSIHVNSSCIVSEIMFHQLARAPVIYGRLSARPLAKATPHETCIFNSIKEHLPPCGRIRACVAREKDLIPRIASR
jgi:hypothetical protein